MCLSPKQAVFSIQSDIRTAEVIGTTTHKANRISRAGCKLREVSLGGAEKLAVSPEAEVLGCVMPRKACQLLMLAEAADSNTWLAFHTSHDVFSLNS